MQNTNDNLWTSGFFNERFPAPISPLGWSLIGPLIEELALRDPLRFLGYPDADKIPLTRLWRGHPYANALAFHIFYKVFPDFILPEDANRYFPNGDVGLRKRAPYPRWIDAPRFVFSLFRTFFSDPFNVSPLNNYRHWARYTRKHDRRIAAIRARLNELANAESQTIFAALREVENLHRDLLRIHRWSLMDADLTFGLLKRLVGSDDAAYLVADVPNKTMEVDAALRQMTNDKLQMTKFLEDHGHRSFSLDIAVPTFADDPSQVTRLLQSMTADHGPQTANPAVGSQRSAVFRAVAALARHYVALREDQRYYWQKALALSRHLYLLLADRLVADGVMANRNLVFYATHEELANYFEQRLPKDELAQSIATRQAEWLVYQHEFEQSPTESYPAFLTADSYTLSTQTTTQSLTPNNQWRGRAVSPGIARGVARLVQAANGLSRVQHGEILVAPSTDPAWTPVFARISGLVVERGGVLSHSAVIAREYHVPAVAGIPGILDKIKDGDVIEVDGSRGVVSAIR
ncbi:MAG: hypothetical protein HZB51_11170 [Chloroflexi bacterium]|nr:hypothetical protein [Chloroflexota bacterium]